MEGESSLAARLGKERKCRALRVMRAHLRAAGWGGGHGGSGTAGLLCFRFLKETLRSRHQHTFPPPRPLCLAPLSGGRTGSYLSLPFCMVRQASPHHMSTVRIDASPSTYSLSSSFSPVKASLLYRPPIPLLQPQKKSTNTRFIPYLASPGP